jgi:methionyl-tRNA synthetase
VPRAGQRATVDVDHLRQCTDAVDLVGHALEGCRFKAALAEVMALARAGNGYFDATKPFASRKTDMDACARAVNVCLQTARTLSTIISPFLPTTAERCAKMLNLPDGWRTWSSAADELPEGHPLSEPEILVKKLDAKELFGA